MYNELIDALRKCGVECKCYGCPYEHKTGVNEKFKCIHMVLSDAADAIELLTDEVDRKDKALQAWVNTWDNAKGKLIDRICENCDTVCGDCPIVQPIREVFNEQ